MAISPRKLAAFAKHDDDDEDGGGHGHDEKDEKEHDEPDGDEGDEGIAKMVDEAMEQVADGRADKRMAKLAANSSDDGDAPQWARDKDKWAKAKDAVEPHWDDAEDPMLVVALVYKRLGGKVG